MKKTIFALFTSIILCLLCTSVNALGERLIDDAELLTMDEAEEISELLDAVSEKHGMDIVILTTDSYQYAYDAETDATERYEALGFNVDGVMLYINMASRDWYVLTSGYGITALTDAGIDYIADQFMSYLSDGFYSDGFRTFAEYTDSFVSSAREGVIYDVDNMPKEPFSPITTLVICLVIGFIAALIVTGIWKGQLKTVSFNDKASNYVKPGSLAITGSNELFLYRNISRTRRQTSSSSGGGSSTHRSSSGRSYGGRGGKF